VKYAISSLTRLVDVSPLLGSLVTSTRNFH
jgi:hypothetical protein